MIIISLETHQFRALRFSFVDKSLTLKTHRHDCSGGESLATRVNLAHFEIEPNLPRQKAVAFRLGQDLG